MFVTNWISTTKIQKISEITNFFRHYFLSRTEVYIYASRPISKIVGEFKIDEILCDTPGNIWKETRCQSGVTRKFFDKYYKGREKAVALKIKECKEYKEAINPESLLPNFKVPQSFIYIEDKITPQTE